MCGLSGIIDLTGTSNEAILLNMGTALSHRGPDFGNQFSQQVGSVYVGMAHRRLSVIDTSENSHQPMHWEHLTLVYNGEIYNFNEIKNLLKDKGHQFTTGSDTEVILHAFGEWGPDFIHKCKGMFVICLYDRNKQAFYIFRDRVGVKPLYYYLHNGLFLFASELKSFHQHPGFVKEICFQGLARFMQYGNVPAPLSIFKNTFKLMPGTFMKIKVETLRMDLETYWKVDSFYQAPKLNLGFEEAKEKTKTLLEASVLARMVSDVPVGLFLSSGYDSTTTAAILQQHQTSPLKTYTVSVPNIGLNEGPKAKQIASFLGCDHTEISCEVTEAIDIIDQLPTLFDEPFGDSSAIPTFLVAKYAQKEIKVALSADGGDEIFGGYNRYQYYFKIPQVLKNIPKPLGKAIAFGIKQSLPILSKVAINELSIQRLSKFSGLFSDFSTDHYLDSMTKAIQDDALHLYLKSFEVPLEMQKLSGLSSPLSELMWNDFTNYLPNDILHKVDRATMAVGLEGREPFLDHELIAFMAQIPDAFKCNANETKILLKSIAHDMVPKNLLDGPKKGFAIPINEWMRTKLSDRLKQFSETDFLVKQGIFNPPILQKMIQSFLNGNNGEGLKTWYFLTFQMWYSKWM